MAFPFQSVGLQGPPSGPNPRKSRPRRSRRWFWPILRQRSPARSAHDRLVFDPLEPRLLLSADVLAINLAHDTGPQAADHSIIVEMVQETQQVNAQTVSVQRVQVVDQSNNAVLAFGDISDISAISIVGGDGNDKLTIDAQSFGGHTAPAISFDGGAGQNNVVFDNSGATTWSLTGKDAGTVAGNGVTTTFQNAGNLTGAADNKDTLTVEQGGTLSGVYDGGEGGNDSLVFDTGPHQTVAYTVGPQTSTLTLDGNAFSFANVEQTKINDPATFTLGAGLSAELSAFNDGSGNNLLLSPTNGSNFTAVNLDATGASFELALGTGDSLKVDALNFDSFAPGTAFKIDGNGSSIDFTGNVTNSSGISASVQATGGQVIAGAHGDDNISATSIDAGITVEPGVTIAGSTISLSAQSSTTAQITTDGLSNALHTATITTENTATININGTINATGDLSVLTGVTLTDTVHAVDGANLTAVTITGIDTSKVELGAAAHLQGASVNIGATTTVNSTITADDLADSFLNSSARIIPSSVTGTLVQLDTSITNTTKVDVPAGAQVKAGTGAVGGSSAALVINAADTTNVISDFMPATTLYLPLINGLLLFSTVDSSIVLDRTTDVLIGDTTPSDTVSTPSGLPPYTIQSGGDAVIAAASGGSISNDETSTTTQLSAVGSTETTAGSALLLGDTTLIELRGVSVNVKGLTASSTSATDYFASSHYVTNTVYGETDALIDHISIAAGTDGVALTSQDNSTLTAIAQSLDINSQHITGIDAFTVTISATSAVNILDKDVAAKITNATVNSAGQVIVNAVDNETIISLADTETVTITTTPLDKGYFVFGGTFAANSILGQVIASIQGSSVTTTTPDAGSSTVGDVQVTAANISIIDAEAQAGSTATGGSLAAGVAGALAINTIGWSGATGLAALAAATGTVSPQANGSGGNSTALDGLAAAINGLLGTSYWTTETPANVTASIVSSTLNVAGALAAMAVAKGVINSTVSNVSDVTGSAIGGTKTGAAGAAIATNKLSGSALAYIQSSTSPSGSPIGGSVTVQAKNDDTINRQLDDNHQRGRHDQRRDLSREIGPRQDPRSRHVAKYTSGSGTQTLNFGDLVQFSATYDTSRGLFGIAPVKAVTLHPGDTVHVSKGYQSRARCVRSDLCLYRHAYDQQFQPGRRQLSGHRQLGGQCRRQRRRLQVHGCQRHLRQSRNRRRGRGRSPGSGARLRQPQLLVPGAVFAGPAAGPQHQGRDRHRGGRHRRHQRRAWRRHRLCAIRAHQQRRRRHGGGDRQRHDHGHH